MNRFNLPDVNFLDKAPENIERDMLFHIESQTGITLSNADPRRKFLQGLVMYVVQERNNLDYALKQNLLAYAEDEYLDLHGQDVNTPRLEDKAAVTTIEFILEEGRVDVLGIPSGTRFLVGENTYFSTDETIVVPIGQHSVQVLATCMDTGVIGNGYLPGEISNLVDPIPWVKEVKNITTSAGGAEVEENDPYAERIRLAPESFSVAGPEGAYEYWAKTTSQDIVDVVVLSPSLGTIDIRVLLKGGKLPTQELLDEVLATCSDKLIRPLTDYVTTSLPETISYDVDIQYWISQSNISILPSIQNQVENAYQNYLIWQKEKMGRDIDLTELITMLKKAGASRVAVNSPMYLMVEKHQVAQEDVTNLSFGGLTDD